MIVSWAWLDLCRWFKHCRQKLWRHGRCFGSKYMSAHSGQETSSRRLWGNVLISMVYPSFLRREREQWLKFSEFDSKQWSLLTSFLFKAFPEFVRHFMIVFSIASANQGSLSLMHVMTWFVMIPKNVILRLLLISSWREVILLSCWRDEFAFNPNFCLLSFEQTNKFHK